MFGGVAVEEDRMDAWTVREERGKIIRDHTLGADVAVETPGAATFIRDVPQCDAMGAEAPQPFVIRPVARAAAQRRHDLPKEIVRMGVILLRLQRPRARHRPQDQDLGIGCCRKGKAAAQCRRRHRNATVFATSCANATIMLDCGDALTSEGNSPKERTMHADLDIRWKQRFQNYQKALQQLRLALALQSPGALEKQGTIKCFEYTFELGWKVLQDYLMHVGGQQGLVGPRPVLQKAFERDIIPDGVTWFDMLNSRNLSSHLYDEVEAEVIYQKIAHSYLPPFEALEQFFKDQS